MNRFPNDTDEEVELVRTLSLEAGALDAQHNTAVVDGGEGAADLARAVVKAANRPSDFTLTYSDDAPIEDKIAAIATKVYGADGVDSCRTPRPCSSASTSCYGSLPICMAKTHLSISHDPSSRARRPASRSRSATCLLGSCEIERCVLAMQIGRLP